MRLGTVKMENFVFIFPLRSALIIFGFAQDRMRLGKAKSENFVFSLGFALGFHYLCRPIKPYAFVHERRRKRKKHPFSAG